MPGKGSRDAAASDGTPAAGSPARSRFVSSRLAWRIALPCVLFGAGVLFAASAATSQGSDLRGGRSADLQQLIDARAANIRVAERNAAALRREVDRATRDRSRTDARLAGPQRQVDALADPTGLRPVRGPSVTVLLDDAPRRQDGSLPVGATPDDVVVHQQDVQAVVNALWAGGAEAMTIMGVRVITTSAVRCVGNTLLLHGRTYSPTFRITAIGNVSSMRAALDRSPGVSLFRRAARDYNLGYQTTTDPGLTTLPAYDGPTAMSYASRRSP